MSYNFKYTKYNQSNELQTKSPINIRSIIYVIFLCFFFGVMIYLALQSQKSYRIECNKKENYCFIYTSTYINKQESVKDNFMISDIAETYIYKHHTSNSRHHTSSTFYYCGFKLKSGRNIRIESFQKPLSCYSFINQLMLRLKSLPPNDYKYTTIYERK